MFRTNWAQQPWMLPNRGDLEIERAQCLDEGKDLSSLEAEFAALAALEEGSEEFLARAEALLDATAALPVRADFPHREPSDLAGIQAARPAAVALPGVDEAAVLDKALGGWQGRAAGCLLGKPAEGRRRWQMEKLLTAQGRWPLDRYFSQNAPEELLRECGFTHRGPELFEEGITCMVEDDDTNYTVTGLAIVKGGGADFTPADVARFWLGNIPLFHVCTAERVAYINLTMGIAPPASASVRNVYREWIGAQIRADFFGYVNPGNTERAADFAWRDAAISHVKNGIYGEMWVAAMLAAAYVCDDVETVIRAGLAQLPATCRLAAAIARVIADYRAGKTYGQMVDDLHARWDENFAHHWCHTISNAEIVAIALLWGEQDFEKTICGAVMPGFDTDCNGATAGSVLGVMLGAAALPAKWIAPMQDTLLTGVAGYHRVSLTAMAEETVRLMGRMG
ncbi:MAG TPA: ADP-ribosylglycohydrolase family protein [Armatimonadota bacterium]|nr:ADP-ribosylglycohydrolase family protein [Armatimonadota bacterium]